MAILANTTQPNPNIEMTATKKVQLRIIELLGFKTTIYTDLSEQMKLFFSHKKISEI